MKNLLECQEMIIIQQKTYWIIYTKKTHWYSFIKKCKYEYSLTD